MNTSEIFLLSLISQYPRYGYEIAQFLEETNAHVWINISMPYVYKLLKNFEDNGWVTAKTVESGNRPAKNVYHITKKGRAALLDGLKSERFGSDKIYFGMDVALAVYAITSKSFDILEVIDEQIKKIQEELERFSLDNMQKGGLSEDAAFAMMIIQHRIGFLQSELEWLKKVRTIVKKQTKKEPIQST